jgi:hypothetical protein
MDGAEKLLSISRCQATVVYSVTDWNKLSPDITKNTTSESFKGALTHDVLLDTYPHRIK